MNVNELLAQIDDLRRNMSRNALATVSNPQEHMQNSLSRWTQENLPSMSEAQNARSVMPGMGDAFNAKLNALAMNSLGPLQTVWHGSPHLFDKFDISKVGTGEGAQAFGHGMYVAENPQVAGGYKTMLAGKGGPLLNGVPVDSQKMSMSSQESMLANMYQNRLSAGVTPEKAAEQTAIWGMTHPQIGAQAASDIVPRLSPASKGAVYKVDLPDKHIDKMLDWDKPLSQQPKTVQELFSPVQRLSDPYILGKVTTGEAIRELGGVLGGQERASSYLSQRGIPGIKYLDQGSRSSGDGTRNYVVFDPSIMTILGRE